MVVGGEGGWGGEVVVVLGVVQFLWMFVVLCRVVLFIFGF